MAEKILMKGNEAIGEAAIVAGCRHYFGYPITPQSELIEYMAKRLPQVGGVFLQAESEVSAINMVYGAAGAGADNDRDKGFKRAMAEFPGITIAQEVFTGWQQDQGKQQINDIIAAGVPFQGVWTSGIDNVIVDAFVESGAPLVPIVGADNAGFVSQLSSVKGLQGAAVTNPGSVGGAGVELAIQILDGKKPAEKTVLVDPELWDNVSDEGKAKLAAAANPKLSPEWRDIRPDNVPPAASSRSEAGRVVPNETRRGRAWPTPPCVQLTPVT